MKSLGQDPRQTVQNSGLEEMQNKTKRRKEKAQNLNDTFRHNLRANGGDVVLFQKKVFLK